MTRIPTSCIAFDAPSELLFKGRVDVLGLQPPWLHGRLTAEFKPCLQPFISKQVTKWLTRLVFQCSHCAAASSAAASRHLQPHRGLGSCGSGGGSCHSSFQQGGLSPPAAWRQQRRACPACCAGPDLAGVREQPRAQGCASKPFYQQRGCRSSCTHCKCCARYSSGELPNQRSSIRQSHKEPVFSWGLEFAMGAVLRRGGGPWSGHLQSVHMRC